MKSNLLERLDEGMVVGDGAMGTLLYERGLSLGRCCEESVLTQREMVQRVHEDYITAGAQVIETNSFGANRLKLACHGLEDRLREINRQAADLAVKVVGKRNVLVAGSVGPLGIDLKEAEVQGINARTIFEEQIHALLEGGVDFMQFETFSDLEELKIALSVAQGMTRVPIVCSMSFTEDGVTHRGVSITEAFVALQGAGAKILGANCCIGPRYLAALFRTKAPQLPGVQYAAFPNAGRPEFMDGRYFYLTTPAYFAEQSVGLMRQGVRLIGGCCGTRPEHIAALRKTLVPVSSFGFRVSSFSKERGDFSKKETISVVEEWGERRVNRGTMDSKPETRNQGLETKQPTLVELIKQRTLVVTEFDSPKTLLLDKMIQAARTLKEAGTDFLTVADNSLAILRVNCVVASHLVERETGLRTIVHLACRDRNLIGTQSELMGMDVLGLNHVLALTGDPSKVGDTPGATSVYDLNSVSLLEGIRSMNGGRTFGGRDLKQPTHFIAGCSFNPNVKELDVQVKRLERKVTAGAQFVMTQPIFDFALAKKTRDATAPFGIPVLIGVMPLLSARNAEFLHNEVPGIVIPDRIRERMRGKQEEEGEREGLTIAQELAAEVFAHFRGIYLITPLARYEVTAALNRAIRSGSL